MWAVYPIVFSISFFCGIFHSSVTLVLAISTISTFSLAAFRPAGPPLSIIWGSYPVVGKGELKDYTFCHYCSRPKSPRTHHCRSCGTCVLDMDHHCPFVSVTASASSVWVFLLMNLELHLHLDNDIFCRSLSFAEGKFSISLFI